MSSNPQQSTSASSSSSSTSSQHSYYGLNPAILDYGSINGSEEEPIIFLPGETKTKIVSDREEDLKKLSEICARIDRFCNGGIFSVEKFPIFLEIGSLANNLHLNDRKEGNHDYIRNKYGSIDRSRQAKQRQWGLEIIYLSALEKIFERATQDQNICREVLVVTFEDWFHDLHIIKEKIKLILRVESESSISYENALKGFAALKEAKNLILFTKYFYSKLIVEELLKILADECILQLNFNSREDRYYFGRVLSIVGELSKDLRDFVNPQKESGLFSFFKKIRDRGLAHTFSAMVYDPAPEKIEYFNLLRKLLVSNFKEIVFNLHQKFCKLPGEKYEQKWENIKGFALNLGDLTFQQKQELKKLKHVIFSRKPDDISRLASSQDKQSSAICTNFKNTEKNINEQVLLKIGVSFNCAPGESSLQCTKKEAKIKEKLIKHSSVLAIKDFPGLLRCINTMIRKSQNCDKILQDIAERKKKAKYMASLKPIKEEIKELIVHYNSVLSNFNDSKIIIKQEFLSVDSLEEIKKELEQKKSDVEEYLLRKEEALSEKDKDTQIEKAITSSKKYLDKTKRPKKEKSKDIANPKEKLRKKIIQISKELDFLISVLENENFTKNKKQYVAEFSFTKIGGLFAKIEEEMKSVYEILSALSSKEFYSSFKETIKDRNKLMHDILLRNRVNVSATLFRQTLPILPELKAMREIIQHEEKNPDAACLLKLGSAFATLKKYEEAFDCFDKSFQLLVAKELLEDNKSFQAKEIIEQKAGMLNVFLLMAKTYGKIGDELSLANKKEAELFYKLKISFLEEQYLSYAKIFIGDDLENPSYIPRPIAAAYNMLGNTYSDIDCFSEALIYHKKAFLIIKKKRGYKDQEALYLFNTAATCYSQLRRKIDSTDFSDAKQFEYPIQEMRFVVAALWETKNYYDEIGFVKASSDYIKIMSFLIEALLYTGSPMDLLRAQEFYGEFKCIIEKFSVRENSQEVLKLKELGPLISTSKQVFDSLEDAAEIRNQFQKQKILLDLDFEIKNLNSLVMFYDDKFGVLYDFQKRIQNAKRRLSELEKDSPVSKQTRFYFEVVSLSNQASIHFKRDQFGVALSEYKQALKKLETEYPAFIPAIFLGDLFENIGDTYLRLEKKQKALKYFKKALEAYVKYKGLNDRAFQIPLKIIKLNQELYGENCTAVSMKMAEETLNNFKKIVNENDPRLNLLKRIAATSYSVAGESEKLSAILNSMDEKCFSNQEEKFLKEYSKESERERARKLGRDSPITRLGDLHESLVRRVQLIVNRSHVNKTYALFLSIIERREYNIALRTACKACNKGNKDVFNLILILLDYKDVFSINLDEKSKTDGQAPIHYAASNCNKDLCNLLVSRGANRALLNKEGKSVAEIFSMASNSSLRHN